MRFEFPRSIGAGLLFTSGVVAWCLWPSERERAPTRDASVGMQTESSVAEAAPDNDRAVAELQRQMRNVNTQVQSLRLRADREEHPLVQPSSEPTTPIVSPQQRHERKVQHFAQAHAEESRDPSQAGPFEEALLASVARNTLGNLDVVDCRSTMCRIELLPDTPGDEVDFDRLVLDGPVKHGAFIYRDDEGRTVAYLAMPGHHLVRPTEQGSSQ